jgi:hypothetical protein
MPYTARRKAKRRKTRRKALKMRGGRPTVINSFAELGDPNTYSQIYVGVGAKWHSYKYDDINAGKISSSQLIPSFIDGDPDKILVILIDTFDENELAQTQRMIYSSVQVKILNHLYDRTIHTDLIAFLQPFAETKQLYIGNYVKFYNMPNISERANRDSVAQLFEELSVIYPNSVYEWMTQTKYLIKTKYKILLGNFDTVRLQTKKVNGENVSLNFVD